MVGKKVVHHLMMSSKDCHYVGGLVNGARIVNQWGDVGTELMVYVDGDISLFLGYEDIKFTAPVYEGDFMEYTGEIIEVDLEKGTITAPCGVIESAPLSESVLKTLEYGGLIPRVRAELGITE